MEILGPVFVCFGFLVAGEAIHHYWFGSSLLLDIIRVYTKRD